MSKLLLTRRERTRETFEEKISHKAKGTQESYKTLLNKWQEFSLEKFKSEDLISELKLVEEDTLWDVLQESVDGKVTSFRLETIKCYI